MEPWEAFSCQQERLETCGNDWRRRAVPTGLTKEISRASCILSFPWVQVSGGVQRVFYEMRTLGSRARGTCDRRAGEDAGRIRVS